MKFADGSEHTNGGSKLAKLLDQLSKGSCETTVVGTTACNLVTQETSSLSSINMVENASIVWQFLKGRKLPGVMAVDRVCLYLILNSNQSNEQLQKYEVFCLSLMVFTFHRHTLLKSSGTTFTLTRLNLWWLILEVVLWFFYMYNTYYAQLLIFKH